MRKTAKSKEKATDDPLPDYRFDYRKAKPNRFAGQLMPGCRSVVLDADVAAVFPTAESVNAVLRALIQNMPRNQ